MQKYTLLKLVVVSASILFFSNSFAMRGGGVDRSVDVDHNGNSMDVQENTSREVVETGTGVGVDRSTTYTNGNGGSVSVNRSTDVNTNVADPAARYRYDQDRLEYEEGYQ